MSSEIRRSIDRTTANFETVFIDGELLASLNLAEIVVVDHINILQNATETNYATHRKTPRFLASATKAS